MYNNMKKTQYSLSYAISVWLIAAAYLFYKYFIEVAPNVMNEELAAFFKASGLHLGILGGAYFAAYLVLQLPMGILLDRFGPRNVVTSSIVLCAGGTWLFAVSQTLSMAILARVLSGFGAAVAAIGCLKMITLLFPPRRFALVTGIMMTIAMLGAVFGEGPLNYAVDQLGWQPVLRITAICGGVLALLFWLMTKPLADVQACPGAQAHPISLRTRLKILLSKRSTWLLSIYSGLMFSPVMILGGLWGETFINTAYNVGDQHASNALSFIFIGFALGAPLFGWLSDYLGHRLKILRWGTISSTVILMLLIYGKGWGPNALILICFSFGFSLSTFLLCFSMIREMNLLIFSGTVMAFMNMFNALSGAIAEPLIGYMLQQDWNGLIVKGAHVYSVTSYHEAMSLLPVNLLIALYISYFLQETFCHQQVDD